MHVSINNVCEKFVRNESGFTLIELLVVISIIGVLSSVSMTSLNAAKAKAQDARRLSDVEQIRLALELYKSDRGFYPNENSSNGSWEISNEDGADFIDALKDEGYFPNGVPVDPVNSGGKYYYYYRYANTSSGCELKESGEFYVLGISDMESSNRPHPGSPGWNCPGNPAALPITTQRNWQTEFDWVAGSFTD